MMIAVAKKLDKLSRILGSLMKVRGLQGRMSEYRIFGQWEKTVGSVIAGHAQPVSVRGSKLFVAVDSPAWMQQLSLLKPEIIEKVNRSLGKEAIREIGLNLGEIAPLRAPADKETPQAPLTLSTEDRASIEGTVAGIKDADVRQALRRVMEKDFSMKKQKGKL
jgi:predicted nucleic acid-binding Zn ribbon protein